MTHDIARNRRHADFDPVVLRAMAKWPDVPACYGWLRLDRRGRWRLREGEITHPLAVAFINRHYTHDDLGRWYFQNGPQRVFVDLDYTPWVFMLAGPRAIVTHTGRAAGALRALHVDGDGNLVLETAVGAGIVIDRDLGALVDTLQPYAPAGATVEQILTAAPAQTAGAVRWRGRRVAVRSIRADTLARHFGFVRDPRPDA